MAGRLNAFGLIICTQNKINELAVDVVRHEGCRMAPLSHYGIQETLMQNWNLATAMGGHVIQVSSDSAHQQMAIDFQGEWDRFFAYLFQQQRAFDSVDQPAIFARLGCSIFMN